MTTNRRPNIDRDDQRPAESLPACSCGTHVPLAMLAQHGGMCTRCYESYRVTPGSAPSFGQPGHVDTPTQRAMRKQVRWAGNRGNVLAAAGLAIEEKAEPDVDLEARKRESAAAAAAYARAHGIQLP